MTVYFITGNNSKFKEAELILKDIELVQKNLEIGEIGSSQEEIVLQKAEEAFRVLKKPVIVDDTGIYFEEYKNFPGIFTKKLFEAVGFDGVERLLKGRNRRAYFMTAVCYKDKNKTKLFSGVMNGKIVREISKKFNPDWQYNSIFIPQGFKSPLSEISLAERAKMSHRKKALEKLKRYLKNERN